MKDVGGIGLAALTDRPMTSKIRRFDRFDVAKNITSSHDLLVEVDGNANARPLILMQQGD